MNSPLYQKAQEVIEELNPTYVIGFEKAKCWRNKNNQLHRLNGPAVIYPSGSKVWFKDGIRHRLDGPAALWQEGSNWKKEWYIEGTQYTHIGFVLNRFVRKIKSILFL